MDTQSNKLKYDGHMDEECIDICDALNTLPSVETTESCCGHGTNPFMIFLTVTDMYSLSILSRSFDKRYIGTSIPWHIELFSADNGCPKFGMYLHSEKPYESKEDMKQDCAKICENITYWSKDAFKTYFLENLSTIEDNNKNIIEKLQASLPLTPMPFGQAINEMKKGNLVRRLSWNESLYVVKQVPSHINSTVIPRMQSLPMKAKEALMENSQQIDYRHQCLLLNIKTSVADSWTPTMDDIFAEDWCKYNK